jgi:hypothetical protein
MKHGSMKSNVHTRAALPVEHLPGATVGFFVALALVGMMEGRIVEGFRVPGAVDTEGALENDGAAVGRRDVCFQGLALVGLDVRAGSSTHTHAE